MKKIYTILILFIIAGIAGVFLITKTNSKKIQLGETFTPQEYWDYQFAIKKEKRKKGYNKADKPDEFTKYFKAITTKFDEEKSNYPSNYRMSEYNKALAKRKSLKLETNEIVWVERGPANVGGRTRGLIVDPDDATHNTWFAGAATGGIWKTTDGGANWVCLTDEFPNLSANTIAMSASNTNIIYAGTGESFPGGTYLKGSGIFKSNNKGEGWVQIVATTVDDNFEYVNRIIVDPNDENIVIAATESGIMKSINGGDSWTKVYSSNTGVEDLREDPTDFNKLYAAENSIGIIKSIDAGENWILSSNGIAGGDRFEIAVSPVNPAKIYTSVNVSSSVSYVYRSVDYGATWTRFEDKNGSNQNFLGGQGTYDNTLVAHPYDEDVVFLGGVNLWKVDFSDPGISGLSVPSVLRVDLIETQSFLSFVNFQGSYLGGGMETGDKNGGTNLVSTDWVSVEVRFGPGITQKAHRFTVPTNSGTYGDGGAGVPAASYEYKDYVDVPFQAWDVKNNRQLMISFRDQERDGAFNLIQRDPDDAVSGREYLIVNAVDYSASTPSVDIAKNGGQTHKQLYYFWPTIATGATWNPNNLPESKIAIQYGSVNLEKGTTFNVSDAYGNITNNSVYESNDYNQGAGMGGTVIPGLHPDHHNLVIVPINAESDSFLIVNANDGGLAISKNSGVKFNQLPNNYITTQFYGVAKKPGANEFIGGMQDNGTWRTNTGENSTVNSDYLFQIGGDGFECMWHYSDPNKIIGSVYYNAFNRTVDGGISWSSATSGITSNDGPFISRVSSHRNTPDNLYALGKRGIYKSTNFGESWSSKNIGTGWLGTNVSAVTSQHHVEASLSNENIIWAGAAMAVDYGWKIFVSTNQGESFTAVTQYSDEDLSGYISGIATHPIDDSTAFLLFSFPGEPKVLRTTNLGQSWEDLSGFVGNTSSSNGFPDVVVHCLLVLPDEPNTIWVGTDIGLFESTDDGATWHYANNGLPAVSVYDMFFQDNQVVVATHGRGIWTAKSKNLPELNSYYIGEQTISNLFTIFTETDSVEIFVNNILNRKVDAPTIGLNEIGVIINEEGEYSMKLISYINNTPYESNISSTTADFNPAINSVAKSNDMANTISISAVIKENYDSLQILLNNNYKESITEFIIGTNPFTTKVESTRNYNVKIVGYLNGVGYESNSKSIYMVYVGISNPKIKSLDIYPNPSNGLFKLDLPADKIENSSLEVFSLSGSKVYSTVITESTNQIDLTHLNSGTYLIKLSKDGIIYSEKVQIRK
ncbi:MAG: T9SS type A sorting domain-containing protein [Bacteroidales bacterium]|jgi:photosystem II stability/assembly factor-like uncharacterized protein|nr:T9SS type A sorting domain-containing protein [Bacteroidales bacterium]